MTLGLVTGRCHSQQVEHSPCHRWKSWRPVSEAVMSVVHFMRFIDVRFALGSLCAYTAAGEVSFNDVIEATHSSCLCCGLHLVQFGRMVLFLAR